MPKPAYACASCGRYGPFSNSQKKQGASRRCTACVAGRPYASFTCSTCGRKFQDQNALSQHEQTHRSRDYPCPGCGKMYRGMTDTARHFESGVCEACPGKDNARRAMYGLVSSQQGGSSFLTSSQGTLQLTHNGELSSGYSETENLYCCPACGKTFFNLSGVCRSAAQT